MGPEAKTLELASVSSASKFELVLDQLSGLIGSGHLKDGDSLPSEESLCSSLGVGRSSVREVLRALEVMGVLERTRQGTRVRNQTHLGLATLLSYSVQLGDVEASDLVRIRRLLEGEAAALAAQRSGEDDVAALRLLVSEMTAAKREPATFVAKNVAFHLQNAMASRNTLLYGLIRSMSALLARFQAGVVEQPGVPEKAIRQHEGIVDAIARRDPVAARSLMEDHISDVAGLAAGHPDERLGPRE